jgi:hypothetical protein
MAKKSVIAREKKRQRLVKKYAELRKQYKEEGRYEELDKLPSQCSLPYPSAQSLQVDRTSKRLHASVRYLPGASSVKWPWKVRFLG